MSVSVIIPTHNRLDGLAGLLEDLRLQEGVEGLEVIVVNSPAGESVTAVVEAARAAGLDVTEINTDNAIGQKRNEGARAAHGDLLVFFDDDMRLGPHVVAAHVSAQAAHPGTIICGAVAFSAEWVARSNYYRFKNSRHLNAARATDFSVVPPNKIVTMNLSIGADLFWSLDGFDTRFRRYGGEDVELGFRATRRGIPMLLCLDAEAAHMEVELDVVGYCRKLYVNAYFGTPRVLDGNPEASAVLTWKWTETDITVPWVDQLLRAGTGLLARPQLVVALARMLRRFDRKRWAFSPFLFKALTILSQRVAADDRRAGRPARPEIFS